MSAPRVISFKVAKQWLAERDAFEQEIKMLRSAAEEMKEALTLTKSQLVKCQKFLPSHGSFGEEGHDYYNAAIAHAEEALKSYTAATS